MSDDVLSDLFEDDQNPYAAPATKSVATDGHNAPFDEQRRKYLSHEASIQSIGLLYGLGAIIMTPVCIGLIVMTVSAPNAGPSSLMVPIVVLPIAVGQMFLAFGLRRLRPWARIPTIVLSVIGLIGFPIGTLMSAYILYLLCSAKGTVVFSEQYQEVIRQTPHIRYKTSIVVWIFLALLLLLIAVGVVAALMG
jgi:hypothetical protein